MIPTPCTDLLTQPQFSTVYPPSEDSFLFLDALEKDFTFLTEHLKPAVVLELGSGSGVISTFLSKLLRIPTMFIGVDISEKACLATKSVFMFNNSLGLVDSVCGNLLSTFSDRAPGIADIILFNPPYVPTSVSEVKNAGCLATAAWAGGIKGRQVIDEFIPQVSSRLSNRGVLYLLLLRENQPSEVHELVRKSSNGRLSKAVCLMNRTCRNENLSVYRYYDPTVHGQTPEI
ncbi:unnamed protein product [Schistocephalus solidus]|uniref:Methyltransferase HEMK2 n=1 Tax=Schistocephalus solidus TaxID=70667 RepID=A0A183TIF0_SCHSO|nr:unnamed protein product [Schistocephalus solidus]